MTAVSQSIEQIEQDVEEHGDENVKKRDIVVREIDVLKKKAGYIDKHMLLEAAREPEHPFHSFAEFHWDDDEEAANQHRLAVCERLLRFYAIWKPRSEKEPDGPKYRLRGLLPLHHGTGKYYPRSAVLGQAETREMQIQEAIKALRSTMGRWPDVEELAPLFKSIESAIKKFEDRRTK